PAQYRGRVDLSVNGTYWAGVMLGSVATIYLLDPTKVAEFWGWRIGFFIGPVLGIVVILIRKHIPESPRWMLTRGYGEQVEEIVAGIEQDVWESGHELEPVSDDQAITLEPEVRRQGRRNFSQRWVEFKESGAELVEVFLRRYWKRTVLG
ncbi:MFS transporter, partial [Escherichia coli]|uniref:MFS transporter n=1 Tax=Escherichia coli TaxID=562 RepID=UPI002234F181